MAKTTYKILEWSTETASWFEREEAQIEAAGSRSAIRDYAAKNELEGVYVAIPMRSFKPVNVAPQSTVKITDAS